MTTLSFELIDNNNGNSYDTTVPYTEWRRGLTQVGNMSATGLYGNGTDLSTASFVQNGQSLVVAGKWFSPGTASLLWDNTISLGTATIDGTGSFNATVTVPTTPAGQHTLTINDGTSFCVNITRLPTVANDYDGLWHSNNVTINLTPDFNVTQTYYRINNGLTQNVSASGQPVITTEGNNNTLEYWSTWDIYGTGLMELPHATLTGIQVQTSPPNGSLQIDGGAMTTSSNNATLTINASDSLSGISQIRFSNDGTWNQSSWQPYTSSVNWQLTSGDGVKTVYCQIIDNAGLTATFNSSINVVTLQTPPSPTPTATPSPTPTPRATPPSTPSPTPSADPTSTPSQLPTFSPDPSSGPESPDLILIVCSLLAMMTLLFAVKHKNNPQ